MPVRSPEWFARRLGKLTGSKIANAMRNGKGTAESVTRNKLIRQLVFERLTGTSQEKDISHLPAIQWGIEQEPEAIRLLEYLHDYVVTPTDTTEHPIIAMAAATPDGLLQGGGVLEVKSPNTDTHMSYIENPVIPPDYRKQMLWEMACSGKEWGKFASFDPRMESYKNKLLIIPLEPKLSEIRELEERRQEFLHEVAVMTKWYRER